MKSGVVSELHGSNSANVLGDSLDQRLFETPAELVCPITHELFSDPVINSAGQIYERTAIERHMLTRLTDPLTSTPLSSTSLTTVFAVRSRALEYREFVARGCVVKTCMPGCQEPVRYLRRAAEMVHGAPPAALLRVPGLAPSLVAYLTTHSSNAFDALALQLFADGLYRGGYSQQAAAVYCTLLIRAADRAAATEALRSCLACWGDDGGASAGAAGGSGAAGSNAVCCDGSTDTAQGMKLVSLTSLPSSASAAHVTTARLADLVEAVQGAMSTTHIVDLMLEAGQPRSQVLQLLEHLMLRDGGSSSVVGSTGGTDGGSIGGTDRHRGLLLKYMQVSHAALDEQLRQLRVVSTSQSSAVAVHESKQASHNDIGLPHGAVPHGQAGGGLLKRGWTAVAKHLRRPRVLGSVVFAALTVAGGRHVATRSAQAAAALFVMHAR